MSANQMTLSKLKSQPNEQSQDVAVNWIKCCHLIHQHLFILQSHHKALTPGIISFLNHRLPATYQPMSVSNHLSTRHMTCETIKITSLSKTHAAHHLHSTLVFFFTYLPILKMQTDRSELFDYPPIPMNSTMLSD